jgi:hypothetical protein
MQTGRQKTNSGVTRYRNTGEKQWEMTPRKTGYAAYKGIDDFLKSYPVSTMNKYGERVISGYRIC